MIFQAFSDHLLVACGGEVTGSILLSEMASFAVREAQFRKKMEKFKATQSKDIVIEVCLLINKTLRCSAGYKLNINSRYCANAATTVLDFIFRQLFLRYTFHLAKLYNLIGVIIKR